MGPRRRAAATDELEAAAALCRSAGYWAAPCRSPNGWRARRTSTSTGWWWWPTSDRPLRWSGRRRALGRGPPRRSPQPRHRRDVGAASHGRRRSSPTSSSTAIAGDDPADTDVALGLVLPCWTLLGMLDRAIELTSRATCSTASSSASRSPRSRACSSSSPTPRSSAAGSRSWRSTRCGASRAPARRGARRRARAAARPRSRRPTMVFRIAHQLHGAIGFCDETTLSWLSRYSQPLRRLPLGLAGTRDAAHPPARPARPDRPVRRRRGEVMTSVRPARRADGRGRRSGPHRGAINRPDELNAVNEALHWALGQRVADSSPPTAKPRWWSSPAPAGRSAPAATSTGSPRSSTIRSARYESLREGAQIIEEMLRFPLPVIAAVNGPAVGLGCSMAMLCDIVLMSETAYLADPHVSVGLVAGDGGAAFWPLLGADHAHPRVPLHRRPDPRRHGGRARPGQPGRAARRPAGRGAHGWPNGSPPSRPRRCRAPSASSTCTSPGRWAGPVQAGFAAEAVTMESEEHRQRLLALRPGRGS